MFLYFKRIPFISDLGKLLLVKVSWLTKAEYLVEKRFSSENDGDLI